VKICIVTGTRADYGLLRSVILSILNHNDHTLQLIVTGTHLSSEHGYTLQEVISDNIPIAAYVDLLLRSDSPQAISKSAGLGLIAFGDTFKSLDPDLLLLLGDRYEILAAAFSSFIMGIPIAHISGGELTLGAYDDAFRHCITKLSSIHFVATEVYRKRVIQMGEHPSTVFNVGALGAEALSNLQLLSRSQLEDALGLHLMPNLLLVTYHPATLHTYSSKQYFSELLRALSSLNNVQVIFTLPNADADSTIIIKLIQDYCIAHPFAHYYPSLGQLKYFSLLQFVTGVVGNSSSGLTEVPSFKKGTINIGDRQEGRIRASSVIDCAPDYPSITHAIDQLFSPQFQDQISTTQNPNYQPGTTHKILHILSNSTSITLKKGFVDIDFDLLPLL